MSAMASQITSVSIVCSAVGLGTENIKTRHWSLCGEFTGVGEFLAQKAKNAENVSIWWRHHDMNDKYIRRETTTHSNIIVIKKTGRYEGPVIFGYAETISMSGCHHKM